MTKQATEQAIVAPSSSPESLPQFPPSSPRLIVPLGRGSHGKTWWVRWAVERAQSEGREVVVADADRTNPTLSAYFDGVLAPPSADDAEVVDWLRDIVEQQIERRFTAVLDLGGGDLVLKHTARQLGLVSFLENHGITPVAVHLIGPDRDDLAYLRDVEQDAVFAPAATFLVLNEALVPAGRSVKAAFQPVLDDPIFQSAVGRGATPLWMPRLAPAHEIDSRRLTFAAAAANKVKAGQKPIGPWNAQLISNWRRDMETGFALVAKYLP